MSLIVEDGTGYPNAEAYTSVSEADLLMAGLSKATLWSAQEDSVKEAAIRAATEFLDVRYRWYGQALSNEQKLQWPRTTVYNSKGSPVRAVVPDEVKKATIYLAVCAIEEGDLTNLIHETGAVKQYFTDGLNLMFDPKTTEAAQLRGKRRVDLELLLRNLGTFVDQPWIEEDKTTVTRK